MNKYIIYFDVFGKKMKTKVEAASEAEAKQKVLDRIKFDKVEQKTPWQQAQDMFDDILDSLK